MAAALGNTAISSWITGVHLAAVRKSETGKPPQKGFELELPVPLFDFGDARRAGANAQVLAALAREQQTKLAAASQLREALGAQRTTHALARHYFDEIVPLRKTVSDEMLLKYNGMLASVFDLLTESRAQSTAVMEAIDASREFWLADAALQAARLGQPLQGSLLKGGSAQPTDAAAH